MRRWIWALVIAVVVTAVALGFLGGGRTALAGPSAGTGPWVAEGDAPVGSPGGCIGGTLLYNLNSEKWHCFKS